MIGAVQAVDHPAVPLVPDFDGAVVGAAHDQRRPASGGIGRIDVARVALQSLDPLTGADVKYSDLGENPKFKIVGERLNSHPYRLC